MINLLYTNIRMFIFLLFITGVLYPLLITGIAQIIMPKKANGSLILHKGKLKGSELIAQKNEQDKYFWPRPSAIDYNPLAPSGGSNYGSISKKLKDDIRSRKVKYGANAPSELLYASGSGLDPHISLEAAYFQMPRIARSRGVEMGEIEKLIEQHTEGRQLGFMGPLFVNVLMLNLALDENYDRRK